MGIKERDKAVYNVAGHGIGRVRPQLESLGRNTGSSQVPNASQLYSAEVQILLMHAIRAGAVAGTNLLKSCALEYLLILNPQPRLLSERV